MSVSSCENFSPVKKTYIGSSRLRSGTSDALRNFKVSTQDIIDAGPSSSFDLQQSSQSSWIFDKSFNKSEKICLKCDICHKEFLSKRGLNIHLGKSHSNSSIVTTTCSSNNKCEICPNSRTFVNAHGLKIHNSRCHKESFVNISPVEECKSFQERIANFKSNVPVLKRIPKGARISVANKLSSVINACVNLNTMNAWEELFLFSYRILNISTKNLKDKSLTSKVKENISHYEVPNTFIKKKNSKFSVYKTAENKISDGDIRGAIRLLSSSDVFAANNSDTFAQLEEKHPPPSRPLNLPEAPNKNVDYLSVSEDKVFKAIMSFPNGSSAGLDGIRPQHLKDLIGKSSCDAGQRLLSEITRLCNFMFSGKIISNFTPFIYGASLCALSKKDGGIRPIAIGSTFRRLASKLGCYYLSGEISNYLKPKQLGFGTRSGCEAAVHSVRSYLTNYSAEVFLKIDFKNAFNSVERDSLLLMVNNKIPLIYPYLWQCYSSPSYLIYNGNLIYSQVGCQQGDPLGPAIFSLSIHPTIERLSSHLNVWYLDDGALGGSAETVLKDLETIIVEFEKIGLSLNYSKCELFLSPDVSEERKIDILKKFESLSPDIRPLQKIYLYLVRRYLKMQCLIFSQQFWKNSTC
jgi:hypothetical protein